MSDNSEAPGEYEALPEDDPIYQQPPDPHPLIVDPLISTLPYREIGWAKFREAPAAGRTAG